jgi:ABC-2 type transport system permease protein
MGIQNYLYSLAETDFYAYQEYRVAIQDASLELSKKGCVEEWNDEKVDLNRFRSYFNLVSEK